MKVNVVIRNSANCVLFNDYVEAKNENEALIKVLENEIIYEGDTISIEEVC